MSELVDFWLAVRSLMWVLLALLALVVLAFVLDSKLSDKEW